MAIANINANEKRNGMNSHLFPGRPHRIIIPRDYTEGVGVRFSTVFPEELSGKIDPDAFYLLVNKVNKYFVDAERVSFYSIVDSILGCMTAYLIFICIDSHYDRCMKKASKFIAQQNKHLWIPKGFFITDPKDKGLRNLEITVIDAEEGPIFIGNTTDFSSTTTEVEANPSNSSQTNNVELGLSQDLNRKEECDLKPPKTPVKIRESQREPLLGEEYQNESKKTYQETDLE